MAKKTAAKKVTVSEVVNAIEQAIPIVQNIKAELAVVKVAGKPWYQSKTIWTNIISAVALFVQIKYGFLISPEYQMLALTVINLVLRAISSKPITIGEVK
jgi:hypothetical protein